MRSNLICGCSFGAFLVAGMLITGSVNTLSAKWQNDSFSIGLDHKLKPFQKPWFQTTVMFLGEMMCLAVYFCTVQEPEDGRKQRRAPPPQGGRARRHLQTSTQSSPFLMLAPALCDILGSTLGGIGLLYAPASVYQMLRGSIILFSAIISKIVFKRRLYGAHWIGIIVTMAGLACVGVAAVEQDVDDTSNLLLGIVLIVLGQLASAVQMVVEEVLLKGRDIPPLKVVGFEGLFGLTVMVAFVLPLLQTTIKGSDYGGSYEHGVDAVIMVTNNSRLLVLLVFFCLSIACYNSFGVLVTSTMTAVHRTLFDSLRVMVVWSVDLFIYYVVSKQYGERWTMWSYAELGGFVLLLIGTMIYNQVIILPGIEYPMEVEVVQNVSEAQGLLEEDPDDVVAESEGDEYDIYSPEPSPNHSFEGLRSPTSDDGLP